MDKISFLLLGIVHKNSFQPLDSFTFTNLKKLS